MMKIRAYLIVGMALVLGWLSPAVSQVEVAESEIKHEETPFFVDAISFKSLNIEGGRLDVFVQVGYDKLSFIKRDDGYYASYELTLDVYDSLSGLISEKLWNEDVKASSFDQSVSPAAYSLTQRTFEIPAGKYFISVILRDSETKTPHRIDKQITVPDYSLKKDMMFSDIMLVKKVTTVGSKRTIIPSISPNVGDIDGSFYLFFEAYNGLPYDSLLLRATVFDKQKAKMLSVDTIEVLTPERNQIFMAIDQSGLPLGSYSVYVQGFSPADPEAPEALATTSRSFLVRLRGMPKQITDLDLAIEQLQYIAQDKEMDYLREAKTDDEKQKRFLEFWKKRDPNPNTPRNEEMEKYYAKVEYANKHFKHYTEGWRTDMGMVYIIFGSPNNVDRHPFESDSKPYEVWSYYDLNHQFIFVDETGFGDYRLTTPIWEVWQRTRR